jgi:hypothetical protein
MTPRPEFAKLWRGWLEVAEHARVPWPFADKLYQAL